MKYTNTIVRVPDSIQSPNVLTSSISRNRFELRGNFYTQEGEEVDSASKAGESKKQERKTRGVNRLGKRGTSSGKPSRQRYIWGNYDRSAAFFSLSPTTVPFNGLVQSYYSYRCPSDNDPRLALLREEWFKDRDVLDIGCNTGHLTIPLGLDVCSFGSFC